MKLNMIEFFKKQCAKPYLQRFENAETGITQSIRYLKKDTPF